MSGPAVAALDIAVPGSVWTALGFVVAGGVCRVGATELVLGAPGTPGTIPGWELIGGTHGPPAIDGIATRWRAGGPTGGAPAHPLTATQIDHVVARTPDIPRTFTALASVGMTLRRERETATMRQGFYRHGEMIVEVVGPLEAAGEAPASLWGLTVTVADIDAAADLLGDRLGAVRDAVQPGRRIATVRPDAAGGLPLALMSA